MNLSELFVRCGDENLQFQILDDCATALAKTKLGSKVTFVTPQSFNMDGLEKCGFVVWVDRKQLKSIVAETPKRTPE